MPLYPFKKIGVYKVVALILSRLVVLTTTNISINTNL
jgi:hypothetical protein